MYQIVSASGWKSSANTRDEAIEKANKHHQDWIEAGAPRTVHVTVYYFGHAIYTTDQEA